MEDAMADAKDTEPKKPGPKKPGEQPPGKFHYNPGNMAGKTVNDATAPEGERTNSDAKVADADDESDAARRDQKSRHHRGKA
jgi:hypothetical protein